MAAMNTEQPEMVPTQFRAAAGLTDAPNRRFDTVIMGRRSYEVVLKEGITSPYTHLEQYVFSRTLTSTDPAVTVVSRDPAAFVRELKRRDGLDLWLCGGGGLAGTLMPEIDELQVKRYPLAIGTGTPMFDHTFAVTAFTVTGTRSFGSGAIVVTYRRSEPAEPRPGNRGPAPPTAGPTAGRTRSD